MMKLARILLAMMLFAGILLSQGQVSGHEIDLSEPEKMIFMVYLQDQADLTGVEEIAGKEERTTYTFHQLTTTAQQTQTPIIQAIKKAGATYRPYWIINAVWVDGDTQLMQTLAQRPDVAQVYPMGKSGLGVSAYTVDNLETDTTNSPTGIEPNITHIGVPLIWSEGITGTGVVIGGQDTGYDWDHPALQQQYRGWDSEGVDHNYNWHDAVHGDHPESGNGSNVCGFDSEQSCDDNRHGTHTMGIMVGDDGAGNQIGIAPGAQWIGCRNMEEGWGWAISYMECFQWFVAPTDLNGDNPRPDLAPHVINNSWECPLIEGCDNDAIALMGEVIYNVRAAGIVVVGSAGNSGAAGCSTIARPPALYDAVFTVGNTNTSDSISGSSSRGPVPTTGLTKPDVVAPGTNIRSAILGDRYGSLSGTSMSGPHVAGLVALLISANPELAGKVSDIEQIIINTAIPLTTSEGCGGDTTDQIPNNTYGYGRIDAWAAYQAALNWEWVYVPMLNAP